MGELLDFIRSVHWTSLPPGTNQSCMFSSHFGPSKIMC